MIHPIPVPQPGHTAVGVPTLNLVKLVALSQPTQTMERGGIWNCGLRLVANAVVLLLILNSVVWAYQHVCVCTSTDVYLVVLVHWILTHHTYTLCSCSLKRGEINSLVKLPSKQSKKQRKCEFYLGGSPNHLKIHVRSKILQSADPGCIISNLSKRQYSIVWKHDLVCSRPKPIILVWEGAIQCSKHVLCKNALVSAVYPNTCSFVHITILVHDENLKMHNSPTSINRTKD